MLRRGIALLALVSPVLAQSDEIAWSKDLTTAFAEAKESGKIVMICINAKHVDGQTREEPAAKGLREVVYKDARVVAKSREFVCALLTPESSSTEYGELRLLGIEGMLISPQHVFVHPAGDRILVRRQYWSHGKGDPAVKALIAMMEEAQAKLADPDAAAGAGGPVPVAEGPKDEERPAWIEERIREVVEGGRGPRDAAVEALVRNDRDGDCMTPLLALLESHKKETPLLADLLRALGRDQLLVAAEPVSDFLGHKEDVLRGMAAVSLEYIGSTDKKVVAALTKAATREKDESIANHMFRALGRCGAGEAKVRSLLLKECESAKSEFGSYGPAIGLAYFEGDKKAARGVEKMLKKIGIPGGRRGGGENTVKRAVLCWTLASIKDWESGEFVREELVAKLENVKAFWVDGLRSFYKTVARACEGEADALPGVEQGVRVAVSFARGGEFGGGGADTRNLMDDYRKDRSGAFTPKGDNLLGGAGDT